MRRKRTPYRYSTASIATSALICLKLTHVVVMDALPHVLERKSGWIALRTVSCRVTQT